MGNRSAFASGAASENAAASEQQRGYIQLAREGYGQLVDAIIRPPRAVYDQAELGPSVFALAGTRFQREDLEIVGSRDLKLQCSYWAEVDPEESQEPRPCVICLHGNSSCRLEALNILTVLLSAGMSVFAFDFAGSGISEGEYVSLGFYERDDLAYVIEYLRASGKVSTLGLWGRSMGAATALLHGDRDPSIAGMVVDSSFTGLETLALELVQVAQQEGYTIPGFVVSSALSMIKGTVRSKAKFDVKELVPIAHADRCFIPALFAHAKGDEFILPHHSVDIHAKYAGDKNIIQVDGDHNTPRPSFFLDSAGIFLSQALQVPPELVLKQDVCTHRLPWQQAGVGYNHAFYQAMDTRVVSPMLNASGNGGGDTSEYDEEIQMRFADSLPVGEASKARNEHDEAPDSEKIQVLVDMGFDEETAKRHLQLKRNHLEAAIQSALGEQQ